MKRVPRRKGCIMHKVDIKIPNIISIHTPCDASIDDIVRMAMAQGIDIPDNLRLDRYGALVDNTGHPIVENLITAGEITVITAHTGVDMTLVTCSIVSGLRNGEIYPGKWPCCRKVIPALFIKGNTRPRHRTIFKELSADNPPSYEIPCGNKENIENNLYHIVKENGFNVFILEARQIVHEYRKELLIACEWAQKHNVGIIIITTQEDRSAEAFFSDICGRDIHFWWSEKIKHEYIVEDRPLLFGDASAFKIMLNRDGWSIQEHAEDELRSLKDRNVTILHQQSENENIKSTDPIMQYRRS